MNRRMLLIATTALALSAYAWPARAGKSEIFTGLVDGVAVGGYDSVSYFSGSPVEGSDAITADWKGAKWRFVSEANRAAFVAAPEKYAPQFGGYCAYAFSKGATAKGDPMVWTVVDSKLYLNLSRDVQSLWKKDIPGNIAAANTNWPKVLEE